MEWIKVEDKVPPFGDIVLLCAKKGDSHQVDCGSLSSMDKNGYNWDFGQMDFFGGVFPSGRIQKFKPTHWCVIVPPKE